MLPDWWTSKIKTVKKKVVERATNHVCFMLTLLSKFTPSWLMLPWSCWHIPDTAKSRRAPATPSCPSPLLSAMLAVSLCDRAVSRVRASSISCSKISSSMIVRKEKSHWKSWHIKEEIGTEGEGRICRAINSTSMLSQELLPQECISTDKVGHMILKRVPTPTIPVYVRQEVTSQATSGQHARSLPGSCLCLYSPEATPSPTSVTEDGTPRDCCCTRKDTHSHPRIMIISFHFHG